jgi:hypothetical protein
MGRVVCHGYLDGAATSSEWQASTLWWSCLLRFLLLDTPPAQAVHVRSNKKRVWLFSWMLWLWGLAG